MTSIQQQQQTDLPSAAFDPETSPIPGQQAWAILDLHGNLVRSSPPLPTGLPPVVHDAKTLYGMLVEATPIVAKEGLKRMTVNFSQTRYVVARDEHHIYLVQTVGQ